jgi:hypothetical protein
MSVSNLKAVFLRFNTYCICIIVLWACVNRVEHGESSGNWHNKVVFSVKHGENTGK